MTHQQREVRNLMLDYRDKYDMARAILEYRGMCLFLLFVACVGWGIAIWKMVAK